MKLSPNSQTQKRDEFVGVLSEDEEDVDVGGEARVASLEEMGGGGG